LLFNDSRNPKNIILIFPDKEKQHQKPLYAMWKEKKQRWYIVKTEYDDEIDIKNAKEILTAAEFVKAIETGRYFFP
jgi:hypothetical protein